MEDVGAETLLLGVSRHKSFRGGSGRKFRSRIISKPRVSVLMYKYEEPNRNEISDLFAASHSESNSTRDASTTASYHRIRLPNRGIKYIILYFIIDVNSRLTR